jgi:glycosyltransferase involved in cell wall biosynthesis
MISLDDASQIPVLLMVRELGIGGSERQLVETALYLQGSRFVPHVGCFRPNGLRTQDLIDAGVPILHLPVQSFRSRGALQGARQMVRYIRDHHIQIVHSFDAPLNIFAAPVVRLVGRAHIITSQRGDRDLTGRTMKWLLRATDRMADAVVVNCQWMRQYLLTQEGVAEAKVRLCYNAVDTERYRRRAVDNSSSRRLVVGTVCALRPEKGLDTLLQAFAQVRDLGPELIIVGSGPEEARLRALSRELEIEADCNFVSATSDVVEWLSRFDLFVLPSRSEAFSNALMEAMACGCCPIASRVGGNPELVEDGQNGLLFGVDNIPELASDIRLLLMDASKRTTFAERSSSKMRQFTYARAVDTMQAIYQSVLNSANPATLHSFPHNG